MTAARDILRSLITLAIASALAIGVAQALIEFGDKFSDCIVTTALSDSGEGWRCGMGNTAAASSFGETMTALLGLSATAGPIGIGLMITIGILTIVAGVIQIVLMVVRTRDADPAARRAADRGGGDQHRDGQELVQADHLLAARLHPLQTGGRDRLRDRDQTHLRTTAQGLDFNGPTSRRRPDHEHGHRRDDAGARPVRAARADAVHRPDGRRDRGGRPGPACSRPRWSAAVDKLADKAQQSAAGSRRWR